MDIETFTVGMLSTNCYVVTCEETKEAIIIDPGLDFEEEANPIFDYIDKKKLKIRFVVNTHGHSDHITGDGVMQKKYCVPVCVHKLDSVFLKNFEKNALPSNILLSDGDNIKFGNVSLRVLHTPGHTMGCICLVGDKTVFTGDTLFAGSIGRTDFPESSPRDMTASLKKLINLSDDLLVYPGHGEISIMIREKRFNPFFDDLV